MIRRPDFLAILLLFSAFVLGPTLTTAHASSETMIGIWSQDHHSSQVIDPALTPGDQFTIDVNITGTPPIIDNRTGGINGFDVTVHYDPSIIEAMVLNYTAPQCPGSEGCLFDSDRSSALVHSINNTLGTARLVVTIRSVPVIGTSGILFRIKFQVAGTGFSRLDVKKEVSLISGPVGGTIQSLPFTDMDGSFNNGASFTLSADPGSGSVEPGQMISTTITITVMGQLTESANLTATGLPERATASFDPPQGTPAFTSQLTIRTDVSTPNRTYAVIVKGTSQTGIVAETTYTLTVNRRDIAVLSIEPSSRETTIGSQLTFTISLRNKGILQETFTVAVLGNQTAIASREVTLQGRETQTIQTTWATAGFSPGNYTIHVDLPALEGETYLSDNSLSDGSVILVQPAQPATDVAVVRISSFLTVADVGQQVNISITVQNLGESAESFNGTVFTGSTSLTSFNVPELYPGQNRTITIIWSTSGYDPGNYTLRAQIAKVAGEGNVDNNILNGPIVQLKAPQLGGSTGTAPLFSSLLSPLGLSLTLAVATAFLLVVAWARRHPSRKNITAA